MVAIFIKSYPENVFVCGGTLISAKHVLTAGKFQKSCIDNQFLQTVIQF